jgi:hypothetical protein
LVAVDEGGGTGLLPPFACPGSFFNADFGGEEGRGTFVPSFERGFSTPFFFSSLTATAGRISGKQ